MTLRRVSKFLLKLLAWLIGIVLILLLAFHIWFENYAEKAVSNLVAEKSKNKLSAVVKKLRIDYFSNKIEIKEMQFRNTDTLVHPTSYKFTAKELSFAIRSKWDLLVHKKLTVDSIIFTNPEIELTRRNMPKPAGATSDTTKKKIRLAEELGNIYKTINQTLAVLNLQTFRIDNARVIVKSANLSAPPLEISKIFFAVKKLPADSAKKDKQGNFLFTNDVQLRVGEQKVHLQDGNSYIGFNEFSIDVRKRLIQILKPDINLNATPGKGTAFVATMKRLAISGLDFNSLYTQPLVKIDSIHLDGGVGDIQIHSKNAAEKLAAKKEKEAKGKKVMPLDEAIRKLPVALVVNHIVISNGQGKIQILKGLKSTVIESDKDNISLDNIRVNDTTGKAIVIGNINYTLYNYTGYTADSIYRYKFDSLQFAGNKIILYNFTLQTLKDNKTNMSRNHVIPKFEITDMDWVAFLLHKEFKASAAVLYNPVFNLVGRKVVPVKKSATASGKKKSIYDILASIDNMIALGKMKIINGQFSQTAANGAAYQASNINLDINIKEVTESKNTLQLLHAIKVFAFDSVNIHTPGADVQISKSHLSPDGQKMLVKNLLFTTSNKNISASLNTVAINDFYFANGSLELNGISWQHGNIRINTHQKAIDKKASEDKSKQSKKGLSFLVHNLSGSNTSVAFANEKIDASLFLKTLSAASLSKPTQAPMQVSKLIVAGENASVKLSSGHILCKDFTIKDGQLSIFHEVSFEQQKMGDTLIAKIPSFAFLPHINRILATNIVAVDSILLEEPDIYLATAKGAKEDAAKPAATKAPLKLPSLLVNGLRIENATLHYANGAESNQMLAAANRLTFSVKNVATQADKSLSANSILLSASDLLYDKGKLKVNVDDKTVVALNNALFNPATKGWQLSLNEWTTGKLNYNNTAADSTQTHIAAKELRVKNTIVSNHSFKDPAGWFLSQPEAHVSLNNIDFKKPGTDLQVRNFFVDAQKNSLGFDSLSMNPGQTPEYFIAHQKHYKNYMAFTSGKMIIDGFGYSDKKVRLKRIDATNASVDIFGDKLSPQFKAKMADPKMAKEKPLIAASLKGIKADFKVDELLLKNMKLVYTEVSAKTKQIGSLNIAGINGKMENLLSRPAPQQDSLRANIDARFLGTIPMHMALAESYTDSLAGLTFQLNLGQGDLASFNSFLGPLVSLRIPRGEMDSLNLFAQGNNMSAKGKMFLYYKDLKAQILDSGNVSNKFKTKLINGVANAVIRKKNTKRESNFEFYRDRQKSMINYFIKMVVNGAEGNVVPGISKILFKIQNKKALKLQNEMQTPMPASKNQSD